MSDPVMLILEIIFDILYFSDLLDLRYTHISGKDSGRIESSNLQSPLTYNRIFIIV